MAYETFPPSAELAASQLYVSVRDGAMLARRLETLNWSLVEHRQEAFDLLRNVKSTFIVDHDQQFPEHGAYFHMGLCDYAKIFSQLESALSYKEASKHRDSPAKLPEQPSRSAVQFKTLDVGHTSGTVISYSDDGDARKSYYESIRSFKLNLSAAGCSFTRKSFEDSYGLKWK